MTWFFLFCFYCILNGCIPSNAEIKNKYDEQQQDLFAEYAQKFAYRNCSDLPEGVSRKSVTCGKEDAEPVVKAVIETCKADELSDADCFSRFMVVFIKRLGKKYAFATTKNAVEICNKVEGDPCKDPEALEELFFLLHNLQVTKRLKADLKRLRNEEKEEIEDAETTRLILGALAAGARSAGESLQRTSASNATPSNSIQTRVYGRSHRNWNQCSSDYNCDFGQKCVKGEFQATGVCAQTVNRSGIPTFDPPNPDSIRVGGKGNCHFNTECPVGFFCLKQGSGSSGNCVK